MTDSATHQPPSRHTHGIHVKILRRLVLKLSHTPDFRKAYSDFQVEVTKIWTRPGILVDAPHGINLKLLRHLILKLLNSQT